MAAYPGRNSVVYLSTTGSGNATNVIKLNKWTIDKTTAKIEVTGFNEPNKSYVQGLADVKGTFDGVWDDTEAKPFLAAGSADGCKLYLYPSANAPGKYWSGPAWVDCSMQCDINGAVTITGNFAANGAWTPNF